MHFNQARFPSVAGNFSELGAQRDKDLINLA